MTSTVTLEATASMRLTAMLTRLFAIKVEGSGVTVSAMRFLTIRDLVAKAAYTLLADPARERPTDISPKKLLAVREKVTLLEPGVRVIRGALTEPPVLPPITGRTSSTVSAGTGTLSARDTEMVFPMKILAGRLEVMVPWDAIVTGVLNAGTVTPPVAVRVMVATPTLAPVFKVKEAVSWPAAIVIEG